MLRPALSEGAASLPDLARALSMSARTLSRKLSQEGTTFEQERDRMRYTMAAELLALTDLKVGDIASSLSFANHAAFDRAFRRWSGTTRWPGANGPDGGPDALPARRNRVALPQNRQAGWAGCRRQDGRCWRASRRWA